MELVDVFPGMLRRYRSPVFTESHGDVLSRGASKVQEDDVCRGFVRFGQAFFPTATDSHRCGTPSVT